MSRVNWPQALAEVSLLALGAVIALGGDAWMDSRRERTTELAYLQALQSDIEETQRIAVDYIAIQQRSIDATLALLEALADPAETADVDSLHVLLEGAFWIETWNPQRGTYQDLVTSGSLGLIQNVELRAALAQSDEIDDDIKRFDDLLWQHWMDVELPFLNQHSDLGRTYQDYTSSEAETPVRFPVVESGQDLARLRSIEFRNIVTARTLAHQDAISNTMLATSSFEELLALIAEELTRFN